MVGIAFCLRSGGGKSGSGFVGIARGPVPVVGDGSLAGDEGEKGRPSIESIDVVRDRGYRRGEEGE